MKKLTVTTKNNSYDILIQKGLMNDIASFIPQANKTFFITNDNLEKIYPDIFAKFKNRIVIKDGEEFKTFETFQFLVEAMLSKKIERKDVVVVFGGGVTGDLAGFAASCVLRGVKFIQIPTTLLAQVDSSVGGKTGFNTRFGKNLVGAFNQPEAVLIDTNLLNTLDEKQIKTGLGEVVKYAFIEKNCSDNNEFYLYDYLLGADDLNFNYDEIVYKSCGLKASVVSKDEKEQELRAVLNFGHTFAHAIESITNYNTYTHGEAVAMGMKSAFELALNLNLIEKEYFDEANLLIDKFNLAPIYKFDCNKEEYIDIMKADKKVQNSKIRLVLPVSSGRVEIFDDIEEAEILKVI